MEPKIFTPTYEVFLVIEELRARLAKVACALVPIDRGELPTVLGADIFYRRATNFGLLALRFDQRQLDHKALKQLSQIATGAELLLLDPTRLTERDRRRLYSSYLNTYEVQIEDQVGATWALAELGHQLEIPVPKPPRRRVSTEWLDSQNTDIPIFTGPNTHGTTGTTPAPKPQSPTASDELPPLPPRTGSARLGSAPEELAPPATPLPHQRLVTQVDHDGSVVPAGVLSPASGPVTRVEAAEPIARMRPRKRLVTPPATPFAKTESAERDAADGSGPKPALTESPAAPAIDVRYLRGNDWLPARLRSLSLKGAYLVAGALPRNADPVHVALGFRGTSAMVEGEVYHVTPLDGAARAGASGFAVRFPTGDTAERRQLIKLLQRARDAGVTIKPPPSRVAVRFPIRWPVRVSTPQGGLEAAALDISDGGMFVRTNRTLSGDEVMFRLPLDNDDAAIRGRAQTVRHVTEEMAVERGLQTGYGMVLVELSALDEQRWRCFLGRVKNRIEKRVLIGGSVGRVRALGDALMACGYAVQTATDSMTMMTALRSATRPPDAALMDPTLGSSRSDARRIESALATLGVPMLSTDRELPSRARISVDRLLEV